MGIVLGTAICPSFAGPASASPTAPASAGQTDNTTVAGALRSARSTGQGVQVTGATTATDTVTANPNGTLTLTRSAVPRRKLVSGTWTALDATLHRDGNGAIVPTTTTSGLRLSAGGAGPLATMSTGGRALAVSYPMTLPAPTLNGATATYPAVLPGVDLQVTADEQGGFSEVLVVHDAAAAADPQIRSLVLATHGTGVTLTADAAGNLSAVDAVGHPMFVAPEPTMWDSATVSGTSAAQRSTTAGEPSTSSVSGPGTSAHVAPVATAVAGSSVTLAPDPAFLSGSGTVYPVFIDPAWTPVGPVYNGWATVSEYFPSSNYWKKTPDPQGYTQAGNSGSMWSHTLINFPIPTAQLAGATIHSAEFDITEVNSYSCTPSLLNLYAPSATLTPGNATWDAWKNALGSPVDSEPFAYGYNASCPAHGVGLNPLSAIQADVAAGKTTQTFGLAGSNEANDTNSWKEFLQTSPTLSITYDHAPDTPGNLTMSPVTSCNGDAAHPVGDGPVSLFAAVSDPDGGPLDVYFTLWATADPTHPIAPSGGAPVPAQQSGTTAMLLIPEANLANKAAGVLTSFTWKVQANDTTFASAWSAQCTFYFDPTRPGAPAITGPTTGTQVGVGATFTITPPGGTPPAAYLYQVNAGPPSTVTADSTGHATITVIPTRFTNTLSVTSLSAGGNPSATQAALPFNAATPAVAPPNDLTGDGNTDLVTVGGTNNLPAGLWLAPGKDTGQVVPAATNIGSNGAGLNTTPTPADFTGKQVITGTFTGTGLQDVLAYATDGSMTTINGTGDGSVLQAQLSSNSHRRGSNALFDEDSYNPLQVANAGHAPGQTSRYPDLIATAGAPGDYRLDYYLSLGGINNYAHGTVLPTQTPDGTGNWDAWTITAAPLADGSTGMYLWKPGTGALYLWKNITFDGTTLTYTPYTIATSGWHTGISLTLQAADINGDGKLDLWTVGAAATTTAYLDTGTTTAPALTGQPAQSLLTATHTWPLNDATAGPITTARDITGTLTATGAANGPNSSYGQTWNTGELFNPDAMFDPTKNGALATSTPAVTTNADFTIAAWVKPATTGGVVLSQNGTHDAGFKLWSDTSDNSWRFAMSTSDTTTPTWDQVVAPPGSAKPGTWAHVTATYKQSTGKITLYVNDITVANATHTTTWASGGAFQIGDYRNQDTQTGYYTGQISTVQTWNQVVDPTQALTPASYYQPMTPTRLLDTRNGTGGTTGPVAANGTVRLHVAGVSGIPATNVTAVALTLTITSPSTNGFLTAYPENTVRPVTSNVNWGTGQTTSNTTITPLGANGYIDITTTTPGTVQIIADVTGYFTTAAQTGNTTYTPTGPTRVLDTRNGIGAPTAKLTGGNTLAVQIGGTNSIPTVVTAVAINITATNETGGGFFITYADGTTRPTTSGLQFTTSAISQLALVPVGANGKIDIYYGGNTTQTDVIGDVVGYFTTATTGQKYHALNATRLADTRLDNNPLGPMQTRTVAQGNTVIALNPTLVLNTTITSPTAGGYLETYPDGTPAPGTSTINYNTGQTIPNLTLATTGNGTIDLYNFTTGTTTHLILDCTGYFATT